MTDTDVILDPGLTAKEARALARTASLMLDALSPETSLLGEPALLTAQCKLEIALMVTGVEL
jgi:hypothetical protein